MYTVNITALILLGIIAIAIGFVIGIMVSTLRSSAHTRKDNAPLVQLPPKGLSDIVHLWRKKRDNTLVVEFELEGLIETASDLSDEQKRKLAQTAQELNHWLGLQRPEQTQAATSTRPVVEPSLPPGNLVTVGAPPEGLKPVPATLSSVIYPATDKPKPVTSSIASQINDILQEMLTNTPLEKRGIRLFELPEKGMVVLVGLDQYDTVDEVPDEIVRKVIKLAVQKWEKQMERGLPPH